MFTFSTHMSLEAGVQLLQWGAQRPGERVLRIWLGGTFTYAGVEKLADPGFLSEGSTTYIGAQLEGFAKGSPIGPLLDLVGNAPVLAGVAVAITEILIGIATLAGIAPATAATVGTLLSVSLWLSASWHIHPYFLGSDSIYAVAWLAYLLSLPTTVAAIAAARARTAPDLAVDDARRTALRGGAVVAGALALGGLAGLVGRSRKDDTTTTSTPSTSPSASTTSTPSTTETPTTAATGVVVAAVTTLRAAGAVNFTDPVEGNAIIVALPNDQVAAFSRTCTHTGCTTSWDGSSQLIVCPCHGSRFDPAARGAAVTGPATRPLTEIPTQVDGNDIRRA